MFPPSPPSLTPSPNSTDIHIVFCHLESCTDIHNMTTLDFRCPTFSDASILCLQLFILSLCCFFCLFVFCILPAKTFSSFLGCWNSSRVLGSCCLWKHSYEICSGPAQSIFSWAVSQLLMKKLWQIFYKYFWFWGNKIFFSSQELCLGTAEVFLVHFNIKNKLKAQMIIN